MTNILEVWI